MKTPKMRPGAAIYVLRWQTFAKWSKDKCRALTGNLPLCWATIPQIVAACEQLDPVWTNLNRTKLISALQSERMHNEQKRERLTCNHKRSSYLSINMNRQNGG